MAQQHGCVEPSVRRVSCTDGQATEPYEQNTQQSPFRGRISARHEGQSQKNWQALVGIVSVEAWPQVGQVIVECRMGMGCYGIRWPYSAGLDVVAESITEYPVSMTALINASMPVREGS